MNRERIIALFCVTFAGWMYYESCKFPKSVLDAVGPSLYPRFLSLVIAVASIALLIISKSGPSEPIKGAREYKAISILLATILMYILVLGKLGFILSTTVFLMILTMYFDRRDIKTKLKIAVSYSVLFSFGMYFFFAKLLGVLLPKFNLF